MKNYVGELMPFVVEDGLILSPQADLSAVFEAFYPEILTQSNADYEALNQGRIRALRHLPERTIFIQQDIFKKGITGGDEPTGQSFLGAASDRFFTGRPFFVHTCYITITQMSPGRTEATSALSSLLRPGLAPRQALGPEAVHAFQTEIGQFQRLMWEAGIGMVRLEVEDLLSTDEQAGWIERYVLQLPSPDHLLLRDLVLKNGVHVGDDHCQFYTLADADAYPQHCSPRITHTGYSTDKTSFPVSYGAFAGPLLGIEHSYNQFIIMGEANETRQRLEKKNKRLASLARYSRENAFSKQAVDEYLNEMLQSSRRPCRVHYNVMTPRRDKGWDMEQVNQTTAAFAQMDAVAKQEIVSGPQLFWAGIPGNAAELPRDHTFETFIEQASCFLNSDRLPDGDPAGIRMGARISGKPLNVDLFDAPMLEGLITNRNLFVCGGSGGGKSMMMNHMLRTLYDQGAHCVTVDIGGSYEGLSNLVGGVYFGYTEQSQIRFNPFYLQGAEMPDTEKKESLKVLLISLWKQETEGFNRAEYVALSNALKGYYEMLRENPKVFPCFNSFYDYLRDTYVSVLRKQKVQREDFDINNFLYVLKPYYQGGEFDYLLNSREHLDLVDERFIVFELDHIKDHPILFPVVTLIIMELFISKMRRLHGKRKILVIEEAWKAVAKTGMAEFIKYVFKTVRKFNGIAAVVTQEIDDLLSSPVIKETIINNADIKILTDMRKFMNRFDELQATLGLSDKAKTILLSVNRNNKPGRPYREIYIDLGGQEVKVYRNELSPEEYYTYTTEESEKVRVRAYSEKYGSLEKGIAALIRDETSAVSGKTIKKAAKNAKEI